MERRWFLRHARVVGLVGATGCAGVLGGQSESTVTPPAIVESWSFRQLDDSVRGDVEDPPHVQCVIGQSIRVRGRLRKGASDELELSSMSHEDGTFELIVGINQMSGAEALGHGSYEVDVKFETPPDQIRVIEDSVTRTVSHELNCHEHWSD